MNNKPINIDAISMVAKALVNLKDQMVFVGGAVAALYADGAADRFAGIPPPRLKTGPLPCSHPCMGFSG
jgi:hypothetical protein